MRYEILTDRSVLNDIAGEIYEEAKNTPYDEQIGREHEIKAFKAESGEIRSRLITVYKGLERNTGIAHYVICTEYEDGNADDDCTVTTETLAKAELLKALENIYDADTYLE